MSTLIAFPAAAVRPLTRVSDAAAHREVIDLGAARARRACLDRMRMTAVDPLPQATRVWSAAWSAGLDLIAMAELDAPPRARLGKSCAAGEVVELSQWRDRPR